MKTMLAVIGEEYLAQEVLKRSIEMVIAFDSKIILLHLLKK